MKHSSYHSLPTDTAPAGTACVPESRRPTILMIDDDPTVLQAIKRRLSRYRVEVLQACHGTHGIWLAMTEEPDLVITDLRMPQGQGQHVVERLKGTAETRHIPIIVLTGLFNEELEHRLWKLGVDEYFIKPVAFEDLRKAVTRFVDLEEKASY